MNHIVENIHNTWEQIMANCMHGVWKHVLPHCANSSLFKGETVILDCIGKSLGCYWYNCLGEGGGEERSRSHFQMPVASVRHVTPAVNAHCF
jgi:hypothetical protein